ncbi:MAG: LCP family protein, partial [Endomicrobia bacterium]|nr:LCP family protein [Endomicrobiia bacterium]
MTPRRILLIIIVCFLLYLFYCSNQSVFIKNTIHQRRTNFLLLGIDAVEGMLHSDTIIFVSYSSKLRQMDIVSIPRDTYVDVEEFKYRKIAEVFAGFYYKTKNKYKAAEILTTLVKEKILTSSTDTEKEIEIPYFLVIDYKSFEKLVDI